MACRCMARDRSIRIVRENFTEARVAFVAAQASHCSPATAD